MKSLLSDVPLEKLGVEALPDRLSTVISTITNAWAIHPETAIYLSRFILERRITRVIEFGAGSSSIVFSSAMSHIGGGALTSIEENSSWCQQAWGLVERHSSVDARLIEAKTRLKLDSRGCYFGYDLPVIPPERLQVQVVFIDAPHGSLGRAGGVHAIIDSLPSGAMIFFDDTARRRDQETIVRLLRRYPQLTVTGHSSSLGRGLTVLTVREPTRGRVKRDVSATCSEMLSLLRDRKTIRKIRSVAAEKIEQAA
jgi:predicted O-methyltransferase YrrM